MEAPTCLVGLFSVNSDWKMVKSETVMSILLWMKFLNICTYKLWTIIFKMGCMSYSGQNPVVFEKGKGGSFIEI
jgi:hypothetical protein